MTFREIARFEFLYQARHFRTWAYAVVLGVVAYLLTRNAIEDARDGGALANSPYVIALVTVISNVLWLVMAPAVAGHAAARDVHTRMDPLVYTTPISRRDYLGGRFAAAFVINAVILLAVPAGMLLAVLVPGVEPTGLGPFQPAAYLGAYVGLALRTAFAATAIQFALVTLSRRAIVEYLASVFLLIIVSIAAGALIQVAQMPTLGTLLDPIGYVTVIGYLSKVWSVTEKNTALIGLQGWSLANDALWVGIALGILALTHLRFRFEHRAA